MVRTGFVSAALVILAGLVAVSTAEIPQMMTYQGKVTDTGGAPVPDGAYDMRFLIYDSPTGSDLLWDSDPQSVVVSGGVFSVVLGESPQPALSLTFDRDYWLEVRVEGDVQSPRQVLSSVGYAYMASGLVPGTTVVDSATTPVFAAENVHPWGSGIVGVTLASSGESVGVGGQTNSSEGTGVLGIGFATSGAATGVGGVSYAAQGTGVEGWAKSTASSDTTYGVRGRSDAEQGIGVFGVTTDQLHSAVGVVGESRSEDGVGVKGVNRNTSGWGPARGIQGTSYGPWGEGVVGIVGSEVQAVPGLPIGVVGLAHLDTGVGVYGEGGNSFVPPDTACGVWGRTSATWGWGVLGEVTTMTGSASGVEGRSGSPAGRGVKGIAEATGGAAHGVFGETYSAAGHGVHGWALAGTGYTCGVFGESSSALGYGVYGYSQSNVGVHGESTSGCGVYGIAVASTGATAGVMGEDWSADGCGVSGIAFAGSGLTYGVFGQSNSTSGRAVCGNATAVSGTNYGVMGISSSAGGYGVYSSGNFAASGTKSCVVKTSRGPTLLYCQESPENWFEDFGEGQLVNGKCHIELNPLFQETVTIDTDNPMKVFLTPDEPGCKGLAAVRGTTGFDVVELHGGKGNSGFAYRVVAKRTGFEQRRLEYCKAGETDSFLYPELQQEELQGHEERKRRIEQAHLTADNDRFAR